MKFIPIRQALYFNKLLECVVPLGVKDKLFYNKLQLKWNFFRMQIILSYSQQLAFFPNWVWALRKSVHFSKRITFSGLQTAETHVLTSTITTPSSLCTCHKPSCCNAHSYQLPCNKSCYCEAYCVQNLMTVWRQCCFFSIAILKIYLWCWE